MWVYKLTLAVCVANADATSSLRQSRNALSPEKVALAQMDATTAAGAGRSDLHIVMAADAPKDGFGEVNKVPKSNKPVTEDNADNDADIAFSLLQKASTAQRKGPVEVSFALEHALEAVAQAEKHPIATAKVSGTAGMIHVLTQKVEHEVSKMAKEQKANTVKEVATEAEAAAVSDTGFTEESDDDDDDNQDEIDTGTDESSTPEGSSGIAPTLAKLTPPQLQASALKLTKVAAPSVAKGNFLQTKGEKDDDASTDADDGNDHLEVVSGCDDATTDCGAAEAAQTTTEVVSGCDDATTDCESSQDLAGSTVAAVTQVVSGCDDATTDCESAQDTTQDSSATTEIVSGCDDATEDCEAADDVASPKDANKVAKTGVSLLQTTMTGDVATDEADEIRVQDMLSEHRYDDDGSSVQTASESSSTDDEVNDLRVEQMLGHSADSDTQQENARSRADEEVSDIRVERALGHSSDTDPLAEHAAIRAEAEVARIHTEQAAATPAVQESVPAPAPFVAPVAPEPSGPSLADQELQKIQDAARLGQAAYATEVSSPPLDVTQSLLASAGEVSKAPVDNTQNLIQYRAADDETEEEKEQKMEHPDAEDVLKQIAEEERSGEAAKEEARGNEYAEELAAGRDDGRDAFLQVRRGGLRLHN